MALKGLIGPTFSFLTQKNPKSGEEEGQVCPRLKQHVWLTWAIPTLLTHGICSHYSLNKCVA